MGAKFIAAILVLLVPLLGLILSGESFSYKEKTSANSEENLLKKLGVELLHKKVSAPDFTLKDPRGSSVNLRSLKGKVVFLNFWATWCPSCKLEMPAMEELHKEFGGRGLVILAVNFQEGPEEVREFLTQHRLTFTTLLDRNSEVFHLYQAWSLPTTYVINRNGEIVDKIIGYRDWHSDLARIFLRQLLEDRG
jgi:peroxiredoxin